MNELSKIPAGAGKILSCIESCKDGNHIIGCLNMINSYGKIVDRVTPQHYFNVKVFLLEKVVKKSMELLICLKEETKN